MDINDLRPVSYTVALKYLTDELLNTPSGMYIRLPERIARVLAAGEPEVKPYPPLHRGDRVIAYDGMGEFSLGIVTADTTEVGGETPVPVLLNGYITPDGERHEPFELAYSRQTLTVDADPAANLQADIARMISGYNVIEAHL